MAKKGPSSATHASVAMSSDSVILVHAFLHTHAPKIAAKFASKFDNLPLAEHAEHAEELSNALVKTVKAAMLVPGSEIAKAMSYLSGKDSPELDEPAKDESHDHVKPSKKKKRDKKRKLPSEEVEDEDAQVSMEELQPAPVAPVVPETPVAEMTEVAQPRPKKPAQGERFQRVKSDNVQFLDERLKDMSYEAKSGAGDWGARANADLIVTRGKAFTKEKNKKKRGSYRGGVIDQGSQCVDTD